MTRSEGQPGPPARPATCVYRFALGDQAVHRRAAAAMLAAAAADGPTGPARQPGRPRRGWGAAAPNRYPHPSAGSRPGRPGAQPTRWSTRSAAILAAVAAVVGTGVALAVGLRYAPVAAWGAVCVTYLARVWGGIVRLDARQTARRARGDDPGHAAMDAMLVAAAVACLIDVVGVLATSRGLPASARTAHTAGAVVSVALSWGVIHTLFTLRYARLYHQLGAAGLDFHQPAPPAYRDFAYFAFSVGMSFGTTDTAVTAPPMRREVLRHGLLSFLFATLVLAVMVNLVVGLAP
jgi:uncharacterized membrane protein